MVCVVCGRAERRCPTQFHSTAVVRAAQMALLTRRGGGGESGERGAGGRHCVGSVGELEVHRRCCFLISFVWQHPPSGHVGKYRTHPAGSLPAFLAQAPQQE